MRPLLFNYLCAQCNNRFKAPGLPDSAYGEFLLVTENGETAYLNSFQDIVFDELRLIFKKHEKKFQKIDRYNESKIFQEIFTITCDESSSGGTYHISEFPVCPVCKSRKMASWGETRLPEFVSEEIAPITHKKWNKLSLIEKELRTDEAIKSAVKKYISE